jgi:hypothetical protein
MEIMLISWMFGFEAMQQGWQAQSALAFRLMRSFAGGAPDQTKSRTKSSPLISNAVAVDIKAQEEAFAAIADVREAPAAITDGQEAPAVRRRKAPKVLIAKGHLAGRTGMQQNARPRLASIPRRKRSVDLLANRDRCCGLCCRMY